MKYGLTLQHRCGSEFKAYSDEFPPKMIVCPTCSEVLVATVGAENKIEFTGLGTYASYKKRQRENG